MSSCGKDCVPFFPSSASESLNFFDFSLLRSRFPLRIASSSSQPGSLRLYLQPSVPFSVLLSLKRPVTALYCILTSISKRPSQHEDLSPSVVNDKCQSAPRGQGPRLPFPRPHCVPVVGNNEWTTISTQGFPKSTSHSSLLFLSPGPSSPPRLRPSTPRV